MKTDTISSRTRVSGWSAPRGGRRPGSVRSGRARSRSRRRSVSSISPSRTSSRASSSRFASLAEAPTSGRSSAGRVPSDLRICVSAPERPRYLTRTASSSLEGAAPAMAARASPATASTRGWATTGSARLGFGRLGELGEGGRIAHGELGQHLAIEQDARLLQRGHERRVRQPRLTAGRVDANDPERPRRPLLLLAVAVRKGAGPEHRLGRCAIQLAPAADVALCLLEHLLAPLARLASTLRAWHSSLPPLSRRISDIGNQNLEPRRFGGRDETGLAQPLPPLRLLGLHHVPLPPAAPFELAGGGRLHTLLRGALRLHFRHVAGLLMLGLRAQHDVQHPPFHPRVVLGDRDVLHGLHHLLEHLPAELRMRHLAALEAHGDLGLVALLEEPAHVLDLEVEVVALGLGAHLHFLDQDRRLLLARFLLPPRLRVLVLAEVHDAADGRLRFRRNLDEVEVLAAREVERLLGRHDAELFALGAHDADLANTDGLVDTDLLCFADRSLLGVGDGERRPRVRGAGGGPPDQERPTVRPGSRAVISRTRSATTRSTATAPTSSPVR